MLLRRNTKQFQRIFEKVSLVVTVVLLKPLGSEAMQARGAAMMLRTERYHTEVARTPPAPR
jgi:hypothetical protein